MEELSVPMPLQKDAVETLYPCDFHHPEEVLDSETLYTVPEIARLLQDLEPDAELEEDTEQVLLDWAIPWVMTHAEDLVVADPVDETGPGYYGLKTDTERRAFQQARSTRLDTGDAESASEPDPTPQSTDQPDETGWPDSNLNGQ